MPVLSTKTTLANYLPQILQQQHFINTSTNPNGGHTSNYNRQIKVNMADERLKVEHPLLESSSEKDKLLYNQHRTFPRYQNHCDGHKFSCSTILSDGEFQLTEPWSATILVEEAQKCKYTVSQKLRKNFLKNHYRKSLNICKDPCRSAVVLT